MTKKRTDRGGNDLIAGHQDIREAYRDDTVAAKYISERFVEPLGAMLHAEQIAVMRRTIRKSRPGRVLEIAPGPARLSADLADDLRGRETLMDASAQMLAQARSRLAAAKSTASLVQADAFNVPFSGVFDLVYSFRLIRHFDASDRRRLYGQVHRALRPGGLLVFDAINERVARSYHEQDPAACYHYDALLTEDQIKTELEVAGFGVIQIDPVQRRYSWLYRLQVMVRPRSIMLARAGMRLVQQMPGGEPMEWVVTCQRQ